jgi:L-ribulose-5-phosphate 3-epimerase
MNQIALHCSSFVGKQAGYLTPHAWGEAVQAAADYYRPPETFAGRFESLILHVKSLGFAAMDVWQPAQLNWQWATGEQIRTAGDLLARHGMTVTSYAGEFGETQAEFRSACRTAVGIHAPLLSGLTALWFSDPDFVVRALKEFDLKLALENHPETTAQEMLDEIGAGGDGRVGTAIDTGWYATRGFDVIRAVRELDRHILHVHLKDVLPGEEHVNCGIGKGIVPLRECVQTLKELGFGGVYSIENHNLDHDPDEELRAGRNLVQEWLG